MKKKLLIAVTCVGMCALPLVGVFKAHAASHKVGPLVQGINLSLSNSATLTNNQLNLFYLNQSQNGTYTNVLSLTTNAAGSIVPNYFQFANLFADSLGNPGTNVAFMVVMNNTNIGSYPGFSDNDNSLLSTNVVTNGFALTAASTNVVTFTLARVMAGNIIDTYTNSMFTVVWTNTGLTPFIASTNLPLSFVTGAKGCIIYQIVVGNSTSTGSILSYAAITGWVP